MTRGIIAGQIKALTMIVAIEGLIPDRRLSRSGTQPAAPPVEADIYESQWRRKQEHQPVGEEPGDPVAATTEAQPAAPHLPEPEPSPEPAPKLANDTLSPNPDRNQLTLANPFINPEKLNRVPDATGYAFDAVLDKPTSLRRFFSPDRRFTGRRR